MSFLLYTSIVLFIIVCLLLILIILIQKGRGGGLSSAFGGGGGNTAFGSKTGDVLTWATSIIFGVFLILAIVLNLLANHRHEQAKAAAGVQTQTQLPTGDPLPNTDNASPHPLAPLNESGTGNTPSETPAGQ